MQKLTYFKKQEEEAFHKRTAKQDIEEYSKYKADHDTPDHRALSSSVRIVHLMGHFQQAHGS